MPDIKETKDQSLLSGAWSGVAIVLIVFLGVQAWKATLEAQEVGREPAGRDTITVIGEGKISALPTLAQVQLGMLSEGREVSSTQKDNSQKVNQLISVLKGLGIAESDLQTSGYAIYPKYEYLEGRQNIIGYSVSQNISVKVRDLDQVGDVISKAGELGINQVNGVTFTLDDPSMIAQDARKKAIADAEKKAKELADALDVKLVRVVSFSEYTPGTVPPMPMYARAEGLGMGGGSVPDIQSGELDVQANVSVTYEIR